MEDEDGETITKVISIRMVTIRRGSFVTVVKETGYDNMDESTRDIPRYTYTRPGISLVSNAFFVGQGERHSRWPGTAQKSKVNAVTKAAMRIDTQIARPRRSFLT